MDQLYPGLGHHLEEETIVAIDGALHETAYFHRSTPAARSSSSPSSKADSTVPAQMAQLIVREALVLGKYTFAATEIDEVGVFCAI
jgi:hypothetical protein